MADNSFTLQRRNPGKLKYLLLTLFPPILVMELFVRLVSIGLLPTNRVLGNVYVYLPLLGMMVLGYFLIFKKNHRIDIQNNTIIETDWLNKESCRINANQIHGFRRNFLKEIILLDSNGKKLLCIEANMSNFDRFEQWLDSHHIHKM